MTTEAEVDRVVRARRVGLVADDIAAAKGIAQDVLLRYPEGGAGIHDLEHAVSLLGDVERKLDEAAEDIEEGRV